MANKKEITDKWNSLGEIIQRVNVKNAEMMLQDLLNVNGLKIIIDKIKNNR